MNVWSNALRAIADEPHRVAEQPVDVRHRFRFEREPATIGVGVHRRSTAHFQRALVINTGTTKSTRRRVSEPATKWAPRPARFEAAAARSWTG
jgi:hypothetical protein